METCFSRGYRFLPCSSASPGLAAAPPSLQRGRAAAARASADAARRGQGHERRGWNVAPDGGLGHGELGREGAERAERREKGQQPHVLLVLHPQPRSHFPAEPAAPQVTHPPVWHICPTSGSPQASSAQRNHSRALCRLPPDLQLQLQDLCSSCSLAEGTRRLLVGSSQHTPPSHPREPLTSSQDCPKTNPECGSPPLSHRQHTLHCPR